MADDDPTPIAPAVTWETWQPLDPIPFTAGTPDDPWCDIESFDWLTAAALWLERSPSNDPPLEVVERARWLQRQLERIGMTRPGVGRVSRLDMVFLARLMGWRPSFLFGSPAPASEAPTQPATPKPAPPSIHDRRRAAILDAFTALGIDAQAHGTRDRSRICRYCCVKHSDLFNPDKAHSEGSTFGQAWKALKKSGSIRDAKSG